MPVDPGKTALYNSLIKDIEKVSKGKEHPVALDAASAGFKNRAFFPSFTYIGADIDFNALLTGIQKYPNDYALHVDMAKCRLGTSFADLVVSTHTIEHIQGERAKLCALKNLVETLKDKGAFILSIPVESFTEAISSFFEQKFSNISYSYHHNVKLKNYLTLSWAIFNAAGRGNIFAKIVKHIALIPLSSVIAWHQEKDQKNSKNKNVIYIFAEGYIPENNIRETIFPVENATQIQEHFWQITD